MPKIEKVVDPMNTSQFFGLVLGLVFFPFFCFPYSPASGSAWDHHLVVTFAWGNKSVTAVYCQYPVLS